MATMNGMLSPNTSRDDRPRQALAHQRAEFLGDLAQQHEARQRREGEDEGPYKLRSRYRLRSRTTVDYVRCLL